LGGFVVAFILVFILFLLFLNRRRRGRAHGSAPSTNFSTGVQQPQPQPPRTYLSSGPRPPHGRPEGLSSHPPDINRNSFSRPFSAPNPRFSSTPYQGVLLPSINVQPNTPSVTGRNHNDRISPVLQPNPTGMPMYHEALQEGAAEERTRITAANASRLGLPVIERIPQRGSVSTVGSEGESRRDGDEHGEGGGNPIQHSTRASSGVFPEP
jgi:hypothetical protein